MKKLLAILLCLLVVFSFAACTNKPAEKPTDEGEEMTGFVDGEYTYEGAEYGSSGYKDVATMTVADGKITAIVWDGVKEDGTMKRDEVAAGNYVMVEGNPTWTEQADSLAQYVIDNQSLEGLTTNEEGKTDVVSGVSIGVDGFITAVTDLMTQATAK